MRPCSKRQQCTAHVQANAELIEGVIARAEHTQCPTDEQLRALTTLWSDAGIRQCFDRRALLQVADSAQ